MFKVLRPTKDCYITNHVVNDVMQVHANVGAGGSLDLFKLYGLTSTTSGSTEVPNVELTRNLIKFDLQPLRTLFAAGKIDPTNPSFKCVLNLSDVFGGQPTPANFSVVVNPLSSSFDEGIGTDVVLFSDYDVANWLSSSRSSPWLAEGCGQDGDGTVPSDYLTSSSGVTMTFSQDFVTGEEDLTVDVTAAVSASLVGLIPDEGFRIAFAPSLETDQHTYFVKRFASRTAYNEELRPKLLVSYDDSIQDGTTDTFLDSESWLFLRNYVRNVPANLTSGSTSVTGTQCLILQLVTPVSGGTYSLYFTGSQHYSGINAQTGIYSASIFVSSTDATLLPQWQHSGSITFTPVWQSLDGTIAYLTGSKFKVYPAQRGSESLIPRYDVTVVGLRDRLGSNEQTNVRINVFDRTSPYVLQASKLPVEITGLVVRDVHYQIRNAVTQYVVVPFDTVTNSTRASSDTSGMYFRLDTSNLIAGNSYVIDVMIVIGSEQQLYEAASPPFKVGAAA